MSEPNFYQLHSRHAAAGQHLSITYTTSGIDGKPSLQYQDAAQSLSFHGDEVRTTDSEVGMLVSVSIRRTIDTGSTSFTLLVPHVNLPATGHSVTIHTQGITTIHRFSVIQAFNQGQTELYQFTDLTGTAQIVETLAQAPGGAPAPAPRPAGPPAPAVPGAP